MTQIRIANLSDVPKLSVLAEQTFRNSFTKQNKPEDIELHCKLTFSEEIQTKELTDPRREILVAEREDELIAYVQMGWGPLPSCIDDKTAGEIERFYVDKAWHGRGLAHELMSESLRVVAQRGTCTAWLGVWEANPRAIAFYKKFKFEVVGSQTFMLGNDAQRDLILARQIE